MKSAVPLKPLLPQLISGLRPSRANILGNNPKDRYGLAKVPFSLIPASTNVFLALGLKNGAKKYGPYNWRVESVQGRVYLEAAYRHLLLLLDGEDFDRDTGIHHGAFILSTIAIYLDAMVQGKLIDNRALPGAAGNLVAFFNELPGIDKTKQDLIDGFKALVPNNHFGTVTGRAPSRNPALSNKPKLGSPTKKPSRRASDLNQGVHADLHMGVAKRKKVSRARR